MLESDRWHEHALLRPPARDARHVELLSLCRHVHDWCRLRARRLEPARRLADAQVRQHHVADGGVADPHDQRSSHHASRDSRDGHSRAWTGRVVDVELVPRHRQVHRALQPVDGQGARGRRRTAWQQGDRVVRRAGDLLDAGYRRRCAGALSPHSPQPRSRADALPRGVPHASERCRGARAAWRL